jgi:hypothetical protein
MHVLIVFVNELDVHFGRIGNEGGAGARVEGAAEPRPHRFKNFQIDVAVLRRGERARGPRIARAEVDDGGGGGWDAHCGLSRFKSE